MPGFTERTGGLVIEDDWQQVPEYKAEGPVLIFTYERDWTDLVNGLGKRRLLVAQGRGKESFMQAAIESTFVEELPYLNQTEWDKMMKTCSALVIRGEESMSRACLSGIPFIWHAYPQSDEYQLVKVKALLERMRPHFREEDFEIIEKAWIKINSPEEWIATPSARNDEGAESASSLQGAEQRSNPYADFFAAIPRLVPGFHDFALSLRKNGDLAANLMTYIEKLDII
jgi:hypothetical protein